MADLITIKDKDIQLSKSAMKVLKELHDAQITIQEMKNGEQEIKEALLDAMEKTGTKKFENEYVSVTLVPGSTREHIDSKKLKEEHPRIYKQYQRYSQTNPYVKITYKGE